MIISNLITKINFLIFGPGIRILDLSSRFPGGNFTWNPNFKKCQFVRLEAKKVGKYCAQNWHADWASRTTSKTVVECKAMCEANPACKAITQHCPAMCWSSSTPIQLGILEAVAIIQHSKMPWLRQEAFKYTPMQKKKLGLLTESTVDSDDFYYLPLDFWFTKNR